ncbi:hypothetical protein ACFFLS_06185 [Flavobacterium procerum]|uniref:Uncharacterized protein n=2 Tax=Flavobacterium TaxID=237 RepID=A0A9N8IYM2_9FLAO|nr:hypothetical protein [Flavobacterium panici]CAC9972894.1 hypothetical protein FLAPXU55_00573 [Flavobacterium panici]
MSEIKLNKHQEMFIANLRKGKTFEIPNVKHYMEQAELNDLSFYETIRNYGGKPIVNQNFEDKVTSMIINFNSPIVKVKSDFSRITKSRVEEMVSAVYGGSYHLKGEDMAKDNHIVITNDDKEESVYLGNLISQFLFKD